MRFKREQTGPRVLYVCLVLYRHKSVRSGHIIRIKGKGRKMNNGEPGRLSKLQRKFPSLFSCLMLYLLLIENTKLNWTEQSGTDWTDITNITIILRTLDEGMKLNPYQIVVIGLVVMSWLVIFGHCLVINSCIYNCHSISRARHGKTKFISLGYGIITIYYNIYANLGILQDYVSPTKLPWCILMYKPNRWWLTDCVSWVLLQHMKNLSLLLQLLAWPSSSRCLHERATDNTFVTRWQISYLHCILMWPYSFE